VDVVQAIAPDEGVNSEPRPFPQDRGKLFGWARPLLAAREAKIVLWLSEIAKALQAVDDEIVNVSLRFARFLAELHLVRQLLHQGSKLPPAGAAQGLGHDA